MSTHDSTHNAVIGEGTIIEPDVIVGFGYHPDSEPATIGANGILRRETIIYCDVQLGDFFQSGHNTVIRAKVRGGDYCTVLNQSTLEGIIRMGCGVRIMSHVYIPSHTWFGDHVFVGPGVNFLNSRYPGRVPDVPTPRGATIEDEVMIGGGSTIMAGITIGARSFIAAGTVVTRDVPARSFVKGCPATFEPLPDKLDVDVDRSLTIQPIDLWHPKVDNWSDLDWPSDWAEQW